MGLTAILRTCLNGADFWRIVFNIPTSQGTTKCAKKAPCGVTYSHGN